MKKSQALAVVIFLTAIPAAAAAQESESADPLSDAQPTAQSRSTSIRQGIKSDAAQAKQGIKRTAREVTQGIKNGAREIKHGFKTGAAEVKRRPAVAQCNDGRYSYTHHRTCNRHGGVKKHLR